MIGFKKRLWGEWVIDYASTTGGQARLRLVTLADNGDEIVEFSRMSEGEYLELIQTLPEVTLVPVVEAVPSLPPPPSPRARRTTPVSSSDGLFSASYQQGLAVRNVR